jgi:hypothetical protein
MRFGSRDERGRESYRSLSDARAGPVRGPQGHRGGPVVAVAEHLFGESVGGPEPAAGEYKIGRGSGESSARVPRRDRNRETLPWAARG